VLLVFVLAAATVIQRRVAGMAQAVEIKRLEDELAAAQTRVQRLKGEIDAARSVGAITRVAEEKLGMIPASDTRMVILQRPDRQ
jgi:hypothetical protein